MQKITRNIIVTGSNKGVGFGIVKTLLAKEGWNIIMACRNRVLGDSATQQLKKIYPNAKLNVEELDISQSKSIHNFIDVVKSKYKHIDVVVNNAGIAWKGDAFDSEVVKGTFQTNFYGTNEFTDAIIPYIVDSGKIINVGSMVGKYRLIKNLELAEKFKNPNINKEQLYALLKLFEESVADNTYAQKGFPKSAYGMSKLGLNIYTRILSQRSDILDRKIQVYVLCPGYVNTDMTSHKGFLTIQQGARTPVYLIQLPFELNHDLQGKFFEKSALSSL